MKEGTGLMAHGSWYVDPVRRAGLWSTGEQGGNTKRQAHVWIVVTAPVHCVAVAIAAQTAGTHARCASHEHQATWESKGALRTFIARDRTQCASGMASGALVARVGLGWVERRALGQ